MRTSEDISAILPALIQARAAMDQVVADKEGPPQRGSYQYASLENVLQTVCPTLTACSILPMFGVGQSAAGTVEVTARLYHTSGQWIENWVDIGNHTTMQELGSDLTYAERYLLMALLAIQPVDKDDDGASGATRPRPQVRERPSGRHMDHPSLDDINRLMEIARASHVTLDEFGDDMRRLLQLPDEKKITRTFLREQMTRTQYDTARSYYDVKLRDTMEEDVPDANSDDSDLAQERSSPHSVEIPSGAGKRLQTRPNDHNGPSEDIVQWGPLSMRAGRAKMPQAQWKALRQRGDYSAALDAVTALEDAMEGTHASA